MEVAVQGEDGDEAKKRHVFMRDAFFKSGRRRRFTWPDVDVVCVTPEARSKVTNTTAKFFVTAERQVCLKVSPLAELKQTVESE